MIRAGKDKNGNWGFFGFTEELDPFVELTEEEHKIFFSQEAVGKTIHWNEETGEPTLVDRPEPTEAEQAPYRIEELKAEIASRDWRVTKALRLGVPVDELYPGETEWYENTIAEINRLEEMISE